jgi:hypothetical protein
MHRTHVSLNRKLSRGSQGIGSAIGSKPRGADCAPFHKPNTALRCPWTGSPAIGQSPGSKFLDTGSKKAGQVDKEATWTSSWDLFHLSTTPRNAFTLSLLYFIHGICHIVMEGRP